MARIIVTGGPGVGKTTLLQALAARGHTIVDDSARVLIQERLAQGLSPRPEPRAFADEILRRDAANFEAHAATPGHVFFDRGVIDALCLRDQAAPLSEPELAQALAAHPYDAAFILPPWRAIYTTDAERDHTFAHAAAVDALTRAWYRRCGIALIEVPKADVAARAEFVEKSLSA